MSNEHRVLSTLGPTLGQRQRAFGLALVMICGSLLVLPFATLRTAHFEAVALIFDAAFATLGFIAAVALFARFHSTRALSCLALGSGFLFLAFTTLPQLLRISQGESFDVRLFLVTSLALPAAVLAYTGYLRRESLGAEVVPNPAARIAGAVFAMSGLAALFTWFTSLMPQQAAAGSSGTWLLALPMTASGLAIVILWQRRHSMFDLWLLVSLTAWVLGVLLQGLAGDGPTLGREFAHLFDLLAVTSPLFVLLTSRPRESRLPDAGTLRAISDELNQPLFAITSNAEATLRFLGRDPPGLAEARAALADIVNDAVRVSQIAEGAQRLLSASHEPAAVIDVGELVHECLSQLRPELSARQVVFEVDTAPHLPGVRGVRRQLMQLLLNLVGSSVDAMSAMGARERRLTLSASQPDERTVAILVADSGAGLRRGGVSLEVCRRIVDAHGGNILVGPGEGGGTILKVTLPVSS